MKPYRLRDNRESYRRRWWQYGERRVELTNALKLQKDVLVLAETSQYLSIVRMPSYFVFAHSLKVFLNQSDASFTVMQSRPHEIWARFFGSSMKDDLRYTPSDCFETFPFPKDFESNPQLEAAGRTYYEFRAELMVKNCEGLTKTYNRFHDPNEVSPEIARLRVLHAAMDRAVLDTYGWTDLQPTCEFLLDYEDDEEDAPHGRQRKKPWHYRWPDDLRDDVLARLLELNKQRAEEERLTGITDDGNSKKPGKTKRGSSTAEPATGNQSSFSGM